MNTDREGRYEAKAKQIVVDTKEIEETTDREIG